MKAIEEYRNAFIVRLTKCIADLADASETLVQTEGDNPGATLNSEQFAGDLKRLSNVEREILEMQRK